MHSLFTVTVCLIQILKTRKPLYLKAQRSHACYSDIWSLTEHVNDDDRKPHGAALNICIKHLS